MPNHSNLVEGGHSGTNDVTSIGKEIGEAVTRYFSNDLHLTEDLDFLALVSSMIKLPMNLRQWNAMAFYLSAGMGQQSRST